MVVIEEVSDGVIDTTSVRFVEISDIEIRGVPCFFTTTSDAIVCTVSSISIGETWLPISVLPIEDSDIIIAVISGVVALTSTDIGCKVSVVVIVEIWD